ncbi:MAG: DMT family transporter [Treponema sp.]|nr:DMT family transporter [Treponema sp.]
MNTHTQQAWGYILAATAIFFWGITFVCTKYLLNSFSSLEILFFRFLAAYLGLWIMHPRMEKIARKDNLLFALAGLSGVVLYQLSENIAIHFTNASNVSVIVSICPLFTAIINQIFLKERSLSPCFLLGFLISISGVILVCFNGSTELEFNPKGDLLALFAGICWGFYSLCISLLNRRNYDPVCATRRIFFFAVLLMLPIILPGWILTTRAASSGSGTGDFIASFSFSFDRTLNAARFSKPLNCLNLLFLGIIASGFCFAAWSKACEKVGTVKVSCGLYLIPVVTVIFAFCALGERMTAAGAIGAVITIAGLFISER